jgi:glycerol uptake facilitator-like aquaporin
MNECSFFHLEKEGPFYTNKDEMREFTAEYLGTLLILSTLAFTGNPLYFVAALSLAIAVVGKMSLAHFNPAITLWSWLAGKIPSSDALTYTSAQGLAAVTVWILGSLL